MTQTQTYTYEYWSIQFMRSRPFDLLSPTVKTIEQITTDPIGLAKSNFTACTNILCPV